MPAEHTEENEALFTAAVDEISEELTPYNISLIFGREDFITEADYIRPIKDKVLLSEIENIEAGEESALNNYYISVRETVQDADKYSPVGIDIFKRITE